MVAINELNSKVCEIYRPTLSIANGGRNFEKGLCFKKDKKQVNTPVINCFRYIQNMSMQEQEFVTLAP